MSIAAAAHTAAAAAHQGSGSAPKSPPSRAPALRRNHRQLRQPQAGVLSRRRRSPTAADVKAAHGGTRRPVRAAARACVPRRRSRKSVAGHTEPSASRPIPLGSSSSRAKSSRCKSTAAYSSAPVPRRRMQPPPPSRAPAPRRRRRQPGQSQAGVLSRRRHPPPAPDVEAARGGTRRPVRAAARASLAPL